jgi:hypothetical protein
MRYNPSSDFDDSKINTLLFAICHCAEGALAHSYPNLPTIVHDADLARGKKVGNGSNRFLLTV